MTFSRRQLYAMGEPLGDSATYRKADGGLILGGGGSSAPAPASSTTTTQDLPDWAKPYAQNVLSQGKALTDINQNPYQPYGGERIAGFSDLQNQSFQGAQNMAPSQQLNTGSQLASGAGFGALGLAANANPQGFQQDVGGYMNPYMNQILAPQLAEANRNYDISATKQAGQATQAGAFGGSRDAIMAAENERNRNMGLNQIYGQGLNTAFTNAQNQYNANTQNQLAGLGVANQAAGQLGQLGQNLYGQNMGINALQNQYGAQQQAQTQQGLTTAYNDFLTQKNYPYQQLSYMQNLVRGTPMGMNTASQVYQAPPTTAQTVTGLGLGAAGAAKLLGANGGLMNSFADGGEVKRYAGNQESVTSSGNTERIIDGMDDPKLLQKSKVNALARGDKLTALMIDSKLDELAKEASMSKGIAGALPGQMADGVTQAAEGGIMRFAAGGNSLDKYMSGLSDLGAQDPSATPEQRMAGITKLIPDIRKQYGASATEPFAQDLAQERANIGKNNNIGEATGLFKAAQAVVQGNNLVRGLTGAGVAYGEEAQKIAKENREANDRLRQSQITLAAANQAREDGLTGKANELFEKSQADKEKALDRTIGVQKDLAALAEREEASKRSTAAQMAAVNKPTFELSMVKSRINAAMKADPTIANDPVRLAALEAKAYEETAEKVKSAYPSTLRAEQGAVAGREKIRENVMFDVQSPSNPNHAKYKALAAEDKKNGTNTAEKFVEGLVTQRMGAGQNTATPQAGSTTPAVAPPAIGTIMNGYRFKGGDPSNQANWERVS
jgi:hypothetical protein